MALFVAYPSLYALPIPGAAGYRLRQVKVFPQIWQLFECLPACHTQDGAGSRIGENDVSLWISHQHALCEVVQYGLETLLRGLGLCAGHLLSDQELDTFSLGLLAFGNVSRVD